MKRQMKIKAVTIILILVMSLPLWTVSAVSEQGQANRNNPVKAEDVELVKKITIKGSASKGVKKTQLAATGKLGTLTTGTSYAIIIGISDYPGTGSDLQYADDDAKSMKVVLMEKYGFSKNNIILLLDSEGNRDKIKAAIDYLIVDRKIGPNDELVFFYSGHGAKGRADDWDRNNVDQAIVVCNQDYLGFDYIWDGELKSWFTGFPTNRIIFIFDSCLSGGMSVLKSTGRIVNMACTANGLSYEADIWGGGHGQFSYYFAIDGMGNGAADLTGRDGNVTVEEAFDYSYANCVMQTPTIADGFADDLLP